MASGDTVRENNQANKENADISGDYMDQMDIELISHLKGGVKGKELFSNLK